MEKKDLFELIAHWDDYQRQNDARTMEGFALWLLDQYRRSGPRADQERMIAYLSARVDRYSKSQVKELFQDLPLIGYDDFILLNTVFHTPNIPKKTLYESNIYEMNSGTQVVNRLKRAGLLVDAKSNADKRTSLLNITEKGKQVRNEAFERLGKELHQKYALLTDEEIEQLLSTIGKLEQQYARRS